MPTASSAAPGSPIPLVRPPGRIDLVHLGDVVTQRKAGAPVLLVQAPERVAVEVHPEAGTDRDRDGSILDAQLSAFDDLVRLLGVVRVAGIRELRNRGRDV